MDIQFSIIVPVYNADKFIENCIDAVLTQQYDNKKFEVLFIDDCSTDDSYNIIKTKIAHYPHIKLYQTTTNGGPGMARNIGIENSNGKWILFLDSDDYLVNDSLQKLDQIITSNSNIDIISYNWKYKNNSQREGRYDFHNLTQQKDLLIRDALTLGTDGSVIYTLILADLIKSNNIKFGNWFHEDVDFIFKVYYFAKNIKIYDEVLYIKNNRENSIVNSISTRHIDGFFKAYYSIYQFLTDINNITKQYKEYIFIGVVGIVASRAQVIWDNNPLNAIELYNCLYQQYVKYVEQNLSDIKLPDLDTRFFKIYYYFINLFKNNISITHQQKQKLDEFFADIIGKSWSCYDIHNSIFLSHNQIRVCCKRFFRDGKIKGDVKLLDKDFTPQGILKAKQNLYTQINRGFSDECSGCPFLEFKEWGKIEKLDIRHISFEYHSVCNMKCIYCSDQYYGGKKAQYDIKKLIDELIDTGSLKNPTSVVWGGGEPTIEENFGYLLTTIVENFPNIQNRVITNSVVYNPLVHKYINNNQISITTSIDAGSLDTFTKIRGSNKFYQVFENLKKYASKAPQNITIKYIIMDQNNSLDEIRLFVDKIKEYKLEKCNFQISFDFKEEKIDKNSIVSIVVLYGLLEQLNAYLIFFDDLLLQRLKDITKDLYDDVVKILDNLGYSKFLIHRNKLDKIVIWGAGAQTKQLLESSFGLKNISIVYIVDNNPEKIGKKYFGYDVVDPKKLKTNNYPIYISAVQNTPAILKQYNLLELDINRLVKGLIL